MSRRQEANELSVYGNWRDVSADEWRSKRASLLAGETSNG
jgi:hypothetical protein